MFTFNSKWDVDKAAESLSTSLFGKSKVKTSLPETQTSFNPSHASALPDSDDEQYTKRDKKRIKKWRKKNKEHGHADEAYSTELMSSYDLGSMTVCAEKCVKSKDKTRDNSGQKQKANVSHVRKQLDITNTKSQKVKQENKSKKGKLNTPNGNIKKKSNNKRTESSESMTVAVNNKSKMIKAEEEKNNKVDSSLVGEGKGKRKRNRKKKSNSKKNKYKHLALNSKSKSENVDILHQSIALNQNVELGKISNECNLMPVSSESSEYISKHSNNAVFVSGAEVKQHIGNNNDTTHLIMEPQVKDNIRKRKNIQDNNTAPIKKLKQHTDNCKDEVPVMNSNAQSIITSTSDVPSTKSSVYQKKNNTMKSHRLLKLLNKAQAKLEQNPVIPNEKDSACDQHEKLLRKDGFADKTKSGTDKGFKQERTSVDTHKSKMHTPIASLSIWGKAAELGQQAKEKLDSARFRYINEQLYSCTGSDALKLFKEDNNAFSVYHEGFQNQVNKWPVCPLDVFIKQIKIKPTNLVIADFGCGDAKLAQSVPQKVHSFDLVALNNRVTVCDMSKTPLPGEKVDIAVFCLSLMGTNITDYILEANRVLKSGGLLKIAEVVSRFSGLSRFVDGVCNCGFQLLNKRDINQMFYLMDFKKIKPVKKSTFVGEIKLKPCIYKRR